MADIRIKDLPTGTPNSAKRLPMDLVTTESATIEEIVIAGRPTATQSDAEAGTDFKKAMTPLTTKQSIAAQVGSTLQAYSSSLDALSTTTPGASGLDLLSSSTADIALDLLGAGEAGKQIFRSDTTAEIQAIIGSSSRIAISPKDYGGVGNGIADDTAAFTQAATAAMNQSRALDLGSSTWRVKNANVPGYTADGERLVCLINNQKLVIVGDKAKILFDGNDYTQYATAFRVINGGYLYMRGVTYDYVKLPFAQGKVLSKTGTTARFTIDTSLGVPTFNTVMRIATYDPLEKRFLVKILEQTNRRAFTFISGTTWEVNFAADTGALAGLTVGDTCVLYHQVNGYGFIVAEDSDVNVDDTEVNSTAGMGIGGGRFLNFFVGEGVNIRPAPGRLIGPNSDEIHVNGCQYRCTITPNSLEGSSDDAINVNNPNNFVFNSAPGSPYNDGKTFLMGGTVELGDKYFVGDELIYIKSDGTQASLGLIAQIRTAAPASTSTPAVTMVSNLPAGFVGSVQNPSTPTYVSNERWNPKQPYIAPKLLARCVRGILVRADSPIIRGFYYNTGGPAISVTTTWGGDREGPVPTFVDIDVHVRACGLSVDSVGGAIVVAAGNRTANGYAPAGALPVVNVKALVEGCPVRPLTVIGTSRLSVDMTESVNNFDANPSAPIPLALGYFENNRDCVINWRHIGEPDALLHFDDCIRVDLPASNSRVVYATSGTTTLRTVANSITTTEGGNTIGAGGRLRSRTTIGAFDDAPISEIGGYFTNRVGTEQQGAAIIRARPFGTAGQTLQDVALFWGEGAVQLQSKTVAQLPAASTFPRSIMTVTNSNSTTRYAVVAGGGSNTVLVFSDGVNWLIL